MWNDYSIMNNVWNHTNPNLLNFWWNMEKKVFRTARYRVLFGGRGSSKSHEFATVLIAFMASYPIRVLCSRAFQNKISESVYSLLESKIDVLGLQNQFDTYKDRIVCKNGSVALFYGLSRNIGEIKSLEGIDICWIEEAEFITENHFNILAPTIRKEGSQLWISFNPQNVFGYIYKTFVKKNKSNAIVKKINYINNPFASSTLRKEAENAKKEDYLNYKHVWLGYPTSDTELTFFSPDSLTFKPASHSLYGSITIGIDVADGGEDAHTLIVFNEYHISSIFESYGRIELLYKKINQILHTLKRHQIRVVYDAIGVGAGVGAYINSKALNNVEVVAFKNSHKVKRPTNKVKVDNNYTQITNEDYYENYKAQSWHESSEVSKFNTISYNTNIDKKIIQKLEEELCTPLKITKGDKKIMVEQKKDMKKRGVPSPNLADAYVMAISNLKFTRTQNNLNSFFGGV